MMDSKQAIAMLFKMTVSQVVIGKRHNLSEVAEPVSMAASCAKEAGLTDKEVSEALKDVQTTLLALSGIDITFIQEEVEP